MIPRITSFNYECLLVGIVSIHTSFWPNDKWSINNNANNWSPENSWIVLLSILFLLLLRITSLPYSEQLGGGGGVLASFLQALMTPEYWEVSTKWGIRFKWDGYRENTFAGFRKWFLISSSDFAIRNKYSSFFMTFHRY